MSLLERIEVARQPKREADVVALLDELRDSPFIGELSPEEMARLLAAGTVLFFYVGDALAGIAAWEMIGGPWVEIGPFYTAQAYRGQGLGGFMVDRIVDIHRETGHRLYGVTKNLVVKQMFVQRGFHPIRLWSLPREIYPHLLRKLTLRKLLRHARKLRPGDSVGHYVKG